jgi:hypothetical protein
MKMPSSGMLRRVVSQKLTDVSEVLAAFITKAVSLKTSHKSSQGTAFQNAAIFTFAVARTRSLT